MKPALALAEFKHKHEAAGEPSSRGRDAADAIRK
jgi:hypothetical protein